MNLKRYTDIDVPFIFLGGGFSPEGLPILVHPKEILTTNRRREARKILEEIRERLAKGFCAAGWISYEAGEIFLNDSEEDKNYETPLLWFALSSEYATLSHEELSLWEEKFSDSGYFAQVGDFPDRNHYLKSLETIHEHLKSGDVYQVNLTFPIEIEHIGSTGRFFFDLRKNQPVPYEAWIHTGNTNPSGPMDILSFSPELFWERKGTKIRTLPMKGTRPRGENIERDLALKEELFHSPKDRAENLMITDLMRNDLGRISRAGSVEVSKLFSIEEYPTVLQMTSEIRSELLPGTDWISVLEALFPGGSITGAPKKRSSEIIRSLEGDRGIYTGGIFFLTPERDTVSIAIRTLEFRKISGEVRRGRIGIGSGITIDSDPSSEWEESWSKLKFLKDRLQDPEGTFYIFTTLAYKRGTFYSLKEHRERMRSSALELGFLWSDSEWEKEILDLRSRLSRMEGNSFRIRIRLHRNGKIYSEQNPMASFPKSGRVLVSKKRIDSKNLFLYHKTNIRELYSSAFSYALSGNYMDMIFLNEKGNLTEGCIHSVFLQKNGEWFTPNLEHGLLPGVARKKWIRRLHAQETSISEEDLRMAEKIILVNSLRGLRPVTGIDFE